MKSHQCSATHFALHFDPSTPPLRQPLDDGGAEARAAGRRGEARLEDPREKLGRDAAPVVLDGDGGAPDPDPDRLGARIPALLLGRTRATRSGVTPAPQMQRLDEESSMFRDPLRSPLRPVHPTPPPAA